MVTAIPTIPTSRRKPMPSDPIESFSSIQGSDLFRIFQKVLSETADLACESIGEPVEGPSVMSLERSVKLEGPIHALVVLRAHRKLGGMLLEKSGNGNGHSDSREAAFDYLVRFYCERLVQAYGSLRDFAPLTTQISGPQLWAARAPSAGCALLVEMYPVEIRIWFEDELIGRGEKI
jgi:hypothetical protein